MDHIIPVKEIEIEVSRGIYAIKNIKNEKRYVGSSKFIEVRVSQHTRDLEAGKHPLVGLQHDWKRFGPKCFVCEILEVVPEGEDLLEAEQKWLNKTKCFERALGYNIAKDARRPMLGRTKKFFPIKTINSTIAQPKVANPPSKEKIAKEFKGQRGNLIRVAQKLNVSCVDIYRAMRDDLATLGALPREA